MKIKVKIVGEHFADHLKGTIQEVEVYKIVVDESIWTVDCSEYPISGYEIEAVDEKPEEETTSSKSTSAVDFEDNQLKSLTVEFK